jgi:hypothetical protein
MGSGESGDMDRKVAFRCRVAGFMQMKAPFSLHDDDPGSGQPGRACVGREQFHLLDGALVEAGEAFGLGQGGGRGTLKFSECEAKRRGLFPEGTERVANI